MSGIGPPMTSLAWRQITVKRATSAMYSLLRSFGAQSWFCDPSRAGCSNLHGTIQRSRKRFGEVLLHARRCICRPVFRPKHHASGSSWLGHMAVELHPSFVLPLSQALSAYDGWAHSLSPGSETQQHKRSCFPGQFLPQRGPTPVAALLGRWVTPRKQPSSRTRHLMSCSQVLCKCRACEQSETARCCSATHPGFFPSLSLAPTKAKGRQHARASALRTAHRRLLECGSTPTASPRVAARLACPANCNRPPAFASSSGALLAAPYPIMRVRKKKICRVYVCERRGARRWDSLGHSSSSVRGAEDRRADVRACGV